jgi:alcohol dehydrogenase
MNGLYLDGSLEFRSDLPLPARAPGESLVRVLLSGICGTDLGMAKGGYLEGFAGVLGHEFVGVVEQSDSPGLVGNRVTGEITAGCRARGSGHTFCNACARGDFAFCRESTTLGIISRGGSHAQFLTLPDVNLHVVPDNVTDVQAAFTEPLAAACEIPERIHVRPTYRTVVVGDGRLGILCAQVLRLTGAEVHVIGRHAAKLAIAADLGMSTEVLARGATSSIPAASADLVVEVTGGPSGLALARSLVRPRGTLIIKSTFSGPVEFDVSRLAVDEVSIIGSRCGPFPAALRLLAAGLIEVDRLVSDTLPLSRGVEAFGLAATPGVMKVLLDTAQ